MESYKKQLEMKRIPDVKIDDFTEALRWKIPEACKSDASKFTNVTYKVCDINRLPSRSISLVGRIISIAKAVFNATYLILDRKIVLN